jgi:hypothetical protein
MHLRYNISRSVYDDDEDGDYDADASEVEEIDDPEGRLEDVLNLLHHGCEPSCSPLPHKDGDPTGLWWSVTDSDESLVGLSETRQVRYTAYHPQDRFTARVFLRAYQFANRRRRFRSASAFMGTTAGPWTARDFAVAEATYPDVPNVWAYWDVWKGYWVPVEWDELHPDVQDRVLLLKSCNLPWSYGVMQVPEFGLVKKIAPFFLSNSTDNLLVQRLVGRQLAVKPYSLTVFWLPRVFPA